MGLKTRGRMMLVYLSASDLVLAAGNLFSVVWWFVVTDNGTNMEVFNHLTAADNSSCTAQAAITSTASLASFFWTSCIALNIYLSVVKQNNSLTAKLHFLTHAICWGTPLTIFLITFFSKRYGLNDGVSHMPWWCWIQPPSNGSSQAPTVVWQLVSGKFWEILSYVFVTALYALIMFDISTYVKRLRGPDSAAPTTRQRPFPRAQSTAYSYANKKLIFVPLVFVLARIWGTVRFFVDLGGSSRTPILDVLAVLQGLGDSAQGFLNCVVFILTTPLIREKFPCRKLRIVFKTSQSEHQQQEEENLVSESTSSSAEHRHNRLQLPSNYGAVDSSNWGASNGPLTVTHSE